MKAVLFRSSSKKKRSRVFFFFLSPPYVATFYLLYLLWLFMHECMGPSMNGRKQGGVKPQLRGGGGQVEGFELSLSPLVPTFVCVRTCVYTCYLAPLFTTHEWTLFVRNRCQRFKLQKKHERFR